MSKEDNLKRFTDAQQTDYQKALAEVKSAQKRSHWMWYIFPQIQGLGFSETSQYYAIRDIAEAREFLNHEVLGTRLKEICNELLRLPENNATRIFGNPDDMKLKSCMTLFASLNADVVFEQVLSKFFNGVKDGRTLEIIGRKNI